MDPYFEKESFGSLIRAQSESLVMLWGSGEDAESNSAHSLIESVYIHVANVLKKFIGLSGFAVHKAC